MVLPSALAETVTPAIFCPSDEVMVPPSWACAVQAMQASKPTSSRMAFSLIGWRRARREVRRERQDAEKDKDRGDALHDLLPRGQTMLVLSPSEVTRRRGPGCETWTGRAIGAIITVHYDHQAESHHRALARPARVCRFPRRPV